MRVIGSFEAKTHFSKLLLEVSQGKKLLITKNGNPVAMLVPAKKPSEISVEEGLERLHHLRKKLSAKKIGLTDIQQMKSEGRK